MHDRFPVWKVRAAWTLGVALSLAGTPDGSTYATAGSAAEPSLRDLEIVRERMIDRWTSEARSALDEVRSSIATLRADGSWPDVDYEDRARSVWKTVHHLYRVQSMATVYREPDTTFHENARLREATLAALRFWIDRDPQNPNWWWNEIGVPRALGPTLVLLGDEVDADLRGRGVKILARAKLGKGTGQNLLWLTEMAMIRSVVEKRPDVVAKAFERIAAEAGVTTAEGIQPDFSFHQHGPQLYSGGYGLGFSVDAPRLAALARETAFAFPREAIEVLTAYLLDGQRWMVRGGIFDPAAVGRELTRRGVGRRAAALRSAVEDLLLVDPPRSAELREFGESLTPGGNRDEGRPWGYRHFWRSDYTAHRRRAFSTSLKLASTRTRGWEIVNSEGLRSHCTADGMHLVFLRGDEYRDIFGAWDWLAIPGATIVQSPDSFRGSDSRGSDSRGTTAFVGGVSNGEYGLTAVDFAKGPLRARKAWFFYDGEIVCLGAGITSETPEPVFTGVNQCRAASELATSDDEGQGAASGFAWLHHGDVGYVFPSETRSAVQVTLGPQTGSWRDISLSYPNEPFTADVFRLWIDHGKSPRNASYVYAVVPGIDAKSLESYRWPVDVLANEPAVQAVRHRDLRLFGASFYKPGRVSLENQGFVDVDRPCLLLLRETEAELQLAAASPDQRDGALTVVLSWKLRGEGAESDAASGGTRVVLSLPEGPLAGSSVVRKLRKTQPGRQSTVGEENDR